MAYLSFALKYRPQNFADVVGQDHVTRTLRNAVASGRLHHAYLFCGPRGTGKTSVARVLAKALNCEQGPTPDPCGECAACTAIRDGRALDIVEIDAASNRGIDEIRDLREKVKYSPAEARHKVYILDEVHMLTTEAFNALLKTLEEPPEHAFFVMATTEPHRVPPTILSRCQRFDFRRIGIPQISSALQRIAEAENLAVQPDALTAIARAADGGMRDAESILDQLVAYAGEQIDLKTVNSVLGATDVETLAQIVDGVVNQSHQRICELVDTLIAEGKDLPQLLDDLMLYARDLSRLALGCEAIGPGAGPEATTAGKQAQALGAQRAMAMMTHLAKVRQQLRHSTQHGLLLESALLEAASPLAEAQPATAAAASAPPSMPSPAPTPARPERQRRPRPQPAPPAQPPTTASAPQTIPNGAELTLELVTEYWPAVSTELRRMGHAPIVALLREGQPTALDGQRLTVTFAPVYQFHYNKISGEYGQTVERAASTVFKTDITLVPVLAEEGGESGAEPADGAPDDGPAGGPGDDGSTRPSPSPLDQVQDVFPGSRIAGGRSRGQ
jgi:DNA polymerase-3 subunit gamma/tau